MGEQASRHDLQAPVLIRDVVRVVEVLNLRAERFFKGSCWTVERYLFDTPYSLDLWSEAPAVWVTDRRGARREDPRSGAYTVSLCTTPTAWITGPGPRPGTRVLPASTRATARQPRGAPKR